MALAELANNPITISLLVGTAIGSLIPDIDEPKSYIGRRSLGVSWFIKKKYGHRGGTHSVIIWFILMAILMTIARHPFTYGISCGYLFHIVGDFFSNKGVPLLLPLTKKRFKFIVTYRTGGWVEMVVFCLSITYITVTVLNIGKAIFFSLLG